MQQTNRIRLVSGVPYFLKYWSRFNNECWFVSTQSDIKNPPNQDIYLLPGEPGCPHLPIEWQITSNINKCIVFEKGVWQITDFHPENRHKAFYINPLESVFDEYHLTPEEKKERRRLQQLDDRFENIIFE